MTKRASGRGPTRVTISRIDTPSHVLSSFDQRVTQWMSDVTVTRGSGSHAGRPRPPRERLEPRPRPHDLALNEPEAPEGPARRVESRCEAVGQDRPLLGQELSRRNAMGQRRIDRFHAPTIPRRLSEAFGCGGGRAV